MPQSVGRAAERLYGPGVAFAQLSGARAGGGSGGSAANSAAPRPVPGADSCPCPCPCPCEPGSPSAAAAGASEAGKAAPGAFFPAADASGPREGCVSLQNGCPRVRLSALFRKPARMRGDEPQVKEASLTLPGAFSPFPVALPTVCLLTPTSVHCRSSSPPPPPPQSTSCTSLVLPGRSPAPRSRSRCSLVGGVNVCTCSPGWRSGSGLSPVGCAFGFLVELLLSEFSHPVGCRSH